MAKPAMKSSMVCSGGMCHKCHGAKFLVLGVLVLVNTLWPFLTWGFFVGVLLVLGGLMKMFKPSCGHCN